MAGLASALMLSAHPPGAGTGSAVRGAVVLAALRELLPRVDVVSLAHPGEERFADPATHLIDRRRVPTARERLTLLPRGGTYFWDEHGGRLADRVQAMVAGGTLAGRYDLVWCYAPLLASAGCAVQARARVLDIDNVPSGDLRLVARDPATGPVRRPYLLAVAAALARQERRRADLHDAVTVTSAEERELLGAVRPPVVVLPNAVPAVPAAAVGASGPQVLFVGSLHYGPNIDAVSWLAAEIAPRLRELVPEAAMRVVGRRPDARLRALCEQAGVEVVADAPSLHPHYHAARVVLAPTRMGGGTGRIKILEALAYGVPVVATPQAVAGLRLDPGRDVLVAPDADGLAAHAAQLLRDAPAAARLGASGRAVWERHHDAARAQAAVQALVRRLLNA